MAQTAIQPVKHIMAELESTSMRTQLAMALPKHLTVERQLRIVRSALSTNSKLAQCTRLSLIGSVVEASQLGLETNTVMGEAHLVPFKNECQLIIGYKGFIKLARQTGKVSRFTADVVYDTELGPEGFFYDRANDVIRHPVRCDGKPRSGKIVYAYAMVNYHDGGRDWTVVDASDIERARSKSASFKFKPNESPWTTDEAAMWMKTAIRRLWTFLPKSVEMQQAETLDTQAESGAPQAFRLPEDLITRLQQLDGDSGRPQADAGQEMGDQLLEDLNAAMEEPEDAPADTSKPAPERTDPPPSGGPNDAPGPAPSSPAEPGPDAKPSQPEPDPTEELRNAFFAVSKEKTNAAKERALKDWVMKEAKKPMSTLDAKQIGELVTLLKNRQAADPTETLYRTKRHSQVLRSQA